jgi:RNA polymerase sigma factor (sigma-70 family)
VAETSDNSRIEASAASIASSLLGQLRQREESAWRKLDHLYSPIIRQWVRQTGLSDADADDIQQEVLRAVWTNVDEFQREHSGQSFRGWLWTITRNRVRDSIRRRARREQPEGGTMAWQKLAGVPEEESLSESAPAADRSELRGLVQRAIQLVQTDVQPHTWQAFWLVVVEGLPATEAAQRLGVAVGSVYTARSRVLVRLREALGPDCESLLNWS